MLLSFSPKARLFNETHDGGSVSSLPQPPSCREVQMHPTMTQLVLEHEGSLGWEAKENASWDSVQSSEPSPVTSWTQLSMGSVTAGQA